MNNFTIEKFKELAQRIIEKNSNEIEINHGSDLSLLPELPKVPNEIAKEMENILRDTINLPEWSLEHFLSLISGFLYDDILDSNMTTFKICYVICLMPDDLKPEKGTIYIKVTDNSIKYVVLHGATGNEEEKKGEITFDELGETISNPWDVKKLVSILPKILSITSKKGHTFPPPDSACQPRFAYHQYLKETIEDVKKYYDDGLKILANNQINISENRKPMEWLMLIQNSHSLRSHTTEPRFSDDSKETFINFHLKGIKIHELIQKVIIYNSFGINEDEAEKGKLTNSLPLTPEKAAAFLNEKLETERYESNDMPALCMKSSFNAYVKLPSKPASKRKIVDTTIANIAKIGSAIENDTIDKNYKYHYDGLFRLNKEILENSDGPIRYFDHHSENDRWISQQTVKYLRDGGKIQINRRNNRFYFQRSLSQYILEANPYFEPDLPSGGGLTITAEGLTITANELFYLEEELLKLY